MIFGVPTVKYKGNTVWERIKMVMRGDSVLCTETIKQSAVFWVKDFTFREVYLNFGWNLNITVTDKEDSRLLNYLTAPNVLIWSAVVASCAIPGFYDPVDLMMKGENGDIISYYPSSRGYRFIDGSVAGDLPMKRISELFNINTFIVSQTNPHVVPFLSVDSDSVLESNIRKKFIQLCKAVAGNNLRFFFA
jgi:predicted acylesterase/phospholipase RssA